MTERLRLHGVTKSFGGLAVASDVCLSLSEGDRTALIGPNGAGKTRSSISSAAPYSRRRATFISTAPLSTGSTKRRARAPASYEPFR